LEADAAYATIGNMSAQELANSLTDISTLVFHLLKGVDAVAVSIEALKYG